MNGLLQNLLTYLKLLSTQLLCAIGKMGQEKQGVLVWAAITEVKTVA